MSNITRSGALYSAATILSTFIYPLFISHTFPPLPTTTFRWNRLRKAAPGEGGAWGEKTFTIENFAASNINVLKRQNISPVRTIAWDFFGPYGRTAAMGCNKFWSLYLTMYRCCLDDERESPKSLSEKNRLRRHG